MTPNPSSRRLTRGRAAVAALLLTAGLSACGHSPIRPKKAPPTPTMGNREPILSRIESAATPDSDLSSVAVVVPLQRLNEEWVQPGGNAGKSYGNLTLSAQPKKLWEARIAGSSERRRLASAPVVGGGLLYAYDTNGVLHAMDAATGAEKWTHSFTVGGSLSEVVFGGGASYDKGVLYVTSGVGEVAALDAKTGAQKWKVKPAGPLRGSPTVAFGSVFVMTQSNGIFALNAADGVLQWQESASVGITSVFGVAAPAAGQGSVVAGFSTGELIAYRYENGRTLWNDALSRTSLSTSVGALTDIDADPIIDNGRVYALGQGGRMAAYDLFTGMRIWELNLAGISTPAIAGEWIFTLTDEAKLLCIARSTGKVRWVAQLARYKNVKKKEGMIYWTGPVLAGDRLWVTNSQGEVHMISAMDGVDAKYGEVSAPVSLAPIVANGIMYILDDSGRITAFK
ncbi:PQQ-binding-like beta-propeller repeat protein [Novosphingobium sp. FSY-8]|uniref:PQQ-binding-like beta-propeller repeat protein n=1 Tax=Novosphingobium ovatum TaxID=1908523 RepID=A0ABW9XBG9_9SPHN|nr:PQQ-binding-like beta-propeller repeat protein [Novosphingobium ovatum]NBC35842.1 PQQ-binding-like beta-propeller repeat protein [Novosphingobium ovatum]